MKFVLGYPFQLIIVSEVHSVSALSLFMLWVGSNSHIIFFVFTSRGCLHVQTIWFVSLIIYKCFFFLLFV
ncbi:hypothetical protein EDC94DRAFT_609073 [Helicostylum pulchrum]|nr:hypothetical protein EDC94DRAFT_609073 [Helicostylum pulchrum]